MKKTLLYISMAFIIQMLIHFILWQNFVSQDVIILVKYYGFLFAMYAFIFNITYIIYLVAKDYLVFSMIGIMFLKFFMYYLIINKIKFEEVDYYKAQVIIPYLLSIIGLTLMSTSLLKVDKKH